MMINSGSASERLFYDVFQKMGILESQLLPMTNPLFSFTRHDEARMWKRIVLSIKIGDNEPYIRTIMVEFTIVKTASPYNGIIGYSSIHIQPKSSLTIYHNVLKSLVLDGKRITDSETKAVKSATFSPLGQKAE